MNIKQELQSQIQQADMVLVGIGKEMELHETDLEQVSGYSKTVDNAEASQSTHWLLPFIRQSIMNEYIPDRTIRAYQFIEELLIEKNYFIVSLCTDDVIYKTSLDPKRIVTPCGNNNKLQCSENCSNIVAEVDDNLRKDLELLIKGEKRENDLEVPVCVHCGKPLIPNKIENQPYTEAYLDQWAAYTKWLQGTLNKTIVIVELGAGLEYPSVIRWPFEKVTFFNHKATIFRIHSKLPQLAEEIKEKGHSIQCHPIDFLTK